MTQDTKLQSDLSYFEVRPITYSSVAVQILEKNLQQFALLQGQLLDTAKTMFPWPLLAEASPAKTEPLDQAATQAELEQLRQQVAELSQRLQALERSKKATHWNKSGEGHFKLS